MATVTSQLTRINDLEGAPTFASIGGGAGAAANTDIFLQAAQSGGRRQSNVTLNGFWLDDGAGQDISAAGIHVGMWVWHTHYGALTDLQIWLGTSTANYDQHDLTPSTDYPKLGGWYRVWVDVSRTPDATGGTGLDETSARYFGLVNSLPTVGGNAANLIMDAIDHTTGGLLLTGTAGVWSDFTTSDENTTNQYGVMRTVGGIYNVLARLTLGSSSSLAFSDSGFVIVFPNQPLVNDTFMGITCDLQHASTAITWTNGVISSAGTKKGDIIVTSTTGSFDVSSCTFRGIRLFTLTSAVSMLDCAISSSGQITAAGATLNGTSISGYTGAANSSAVVWDVNTDPDGFLDNMTFTKGSGSVHAIELGTTSPTTITFNGHSYSGYNASNNQDDSTIHVKRTTGTVTINVTGGDTPSYRTDGATVVINNTVTLTVTCKDKNGTAVQNARVAIYTDDANEDELMNELTTASGIATEGYAYVSDKAVFIRVRAAGLSPPYQDVETAGTITASGLSVQVTLQEDLILN